MSRRTLRLAVLPAMALATAGATAVELTTHVRSNGPVYLVFGLTVAWAFAIAGLIAWRRRPGNRTGPLMVAIAFAWLAASMTDSRSDTVFTLGLVLANLWPGLLVHLLLAYPSGLLDRRSKIVVAIAYADTLGLALLTLPFSQPRTDIAGVPRSAASNLALISHQHQVVFTLEALATVIAVPVIVLILLEVRRRWKSASPAARRVLAPLYATGAFAIAMLLVLVVSSTIWPATSHVAFYGFSLAFAGIPVGYLVGILHTRLDRASAIGLLVERLRDRPAAGGVRDALREALNDPTLELAYRRSGGDEYVDVAGEPFVLPPPGAGRSVQLVRREGAVVAAIVHDPSLLEDGGLVDAVSGAAALAIQNERLQAELRAQIQEVGASERRLRLLLENVRLVAVTTDLEGRITFCNEYMCELTGWSREELLGRGWAETFNPDSRIVGQLAESRVRAHEEAPMRTRSGEVLEMAWSTTLDRDAEGRITGATGIGEDVTERNRATAELRRVARRQAALRRVATAVAAAADPAVVFHLVAEEVGRLLGGRAAALVRFDPAGDAGSVVGEWAAEGYTGMQVGSRLTFDGPTAVARVARSGRSVRIDDYRELRGEYAAQVRTLGFNAAVAAPIMVDARLRGAIVVSTVLGAPLPADAEAGVAQFAELVALGLANAEARSELAGSRARIVTAGDAERRRLERNLHDGAQQRLVSLSVALRMIRGALDNPAMAQRQLDSASEELRLALEELRELARGIHPAVLTDYGLEAALNALVQRPSPVPVTLDVELDCPLDSQVEAAVYYVAAEALANAAKHSRAEHASVSVRCEGGQVTLEVTDDGVGGADRYDGDGLRGLNDRLAVLGGGLELLSPEGVGTVVTARVPITRPAAHMLPV
jgi:PAS domain S-box-containing protein